MKWSQLTISRELWAVAVVLSWSSVASGLQPFTGVRFWWRGRDVPIGGHVIESHVFGWILVAVGLILAAVFHALDFAEMVDE